MPYQIPMTISRKRILVTGKVQKVGYGDHVQDLSRKCDVVGQIENLRDGYSVEIICEGEEGNVDEFVKEIEAGKGKKASFNPFVEVEGIKVLTEEPTANLIFLR